MGELILIELDDILRIHHRKLKKPPIEYRLSRGERLEFDRGLAEWMKKMENHPEFATSFEKSQAAMSLHEEEWALKNPDKQIYPGPYLLRISDQGAWLSRDGESWDEAVVRPPYAGPERAIWNGYCDLYAEAVGVTSQTMKKRLGAIRKRLFETPNRWQPWNKIYTWVESPDLMWDCFYRHTWVETREVAGKREIRYVRQ